MAVKLADFGIAMFVDKDGEECKDKIRGTDGWRSPETDRKKKILTRKSDIFSLGAVLYHVCTTVQRAELKKPYDTQEWDLKHNLYLTHRFDPQDFPIDHDYRADLKELIAAMMHPDWTQRPSAAEILARIEDWPRFKNDFEKAESVFTFLENFEGIQIRTSNTNAYYSS